MESEKIDHLQINDDASFSVAHAVQATANSLARHKTLKGLQEAPRMSHDQFMELIGFPEVKELQAKYMPPH